MDCGPVRPAVGGEQNGSSSSHNPANFFRRSRTSSEIGEHVAGLPRPRGTAVIGEFDHTDVTDAPEAFPAGSVDQVLNEATGNERGRSADIFAKSRGRSGGRR